MNAVENLNLITTMLRSIWNFFSIPHPLIGIPFSTIFLGAFAISFSIIILRPILGIGQSVISSIPTRGLLRRSRAQKPRDHYNPERYKRQYERKQRRLEKHNSKSTALVVRK